MGHTMNLLLISGAMFVLLLIAGLTDPVLSAYPSKDAVRIFDINVRTEANGNVPTLWDVLSGVGDRGQ